MKRKMRIQIANMLFGGFVSRTGVPSESRVDGQFELF